MSTAMLAREHISWLLCGVALCASNSGVAEEEAELEMEFLEYLGMWDGSDEDWQLLDEAAVAEHEERNDPVPKGKESTESEDES